MAEIAGLALGVVPMGIKLVREVQDYVNAIDSREIDILTAMVEIDTLKQSLEFIDIKLSKTNQVNPATGSVISRACELVRRKLETVLDLVEDLRADPGGGTPQARRIKAIGMKAIYPFRREGLTKLQTEPRELNVILNTALRPLDDKCQPAVKTRSYSLGLRLTSCNKYMATVVALAINATIGFGGAQWSFSPGIRTYNHIEMRRSPLRRLWKAVPIATCLSDDRRTTLRPVYHDLAEYWKSSMRALVQDGKASPLDVDFGTGESILHLVVAKDLCSQKEVMEMVFVTSSGLMANPELIEGQLSATLARSIILQSQSDFMKMLKANAVDLEDALQDEFKIGSTALGVVDFTLVWFPEGLSTLMVALSQSPKQYQPKEALEYLASAARLPILASLMHGRGFSKLVGRSTEGYDDAVRLALRLDCAVPPVAGCSIHTDLFYALAPPLYPLIASHLGDRRKRLAKLAKKHLDTRELGDLGMTSTKLGLEPIEGCLAGNVWHTLKLKGLDLPRALHPYVGVEWPLVPRRPWAFADCSTMAQAEALLEQGFVPEPIVQDYLSRGFGGLCNSLEFHVWLLLRCEDTMRETPLPRETGIAGMNTPFILATALGRSIASGRFLACAARKDPPFAVPQNFGTIMSKDGSHSCTCRCSAGGCTLGVALIRGILSTNQQWMGKPRVQRGLSRSTLASVIEVAGRFEECFENRDLHDEIMAFVRVWAFDVLGCRHTCCAIAAQPSTLFSDVVIELPDAEECRFSHEEDSLAFEALEVLLEQVDTFWHARKPEETLEMFIRSRCWPAISGAYEQMMSQRGAAMEPMLKFGIRETVEWPEEQRFLHEDTASDVSSLCSDLNADALAYRQEQEIMAHKRLIDRICGHEVAENGRTTQRGRWRRYPEYGGYDD
ncbi:hypothetical protein CC79DRAFT_1355055 [Sarocladium strictum]